MELYIGRQILHGDIQGGVQKIVFTLDRLLDHCEKPDILEDLRLRLCLPGAPSLDDADINDVQSSERAAPPNITIAFFREEEDCIGRGNRCEEVDLPCRVLNPIADQT